MLLKSLGRVTAAADLLRPRTFFRTLARVSELADTARDLRLQVAALERRTEQLLAIEQLEWDHRKEMERLASLDPAAVGAHVERAVAASPLDLDPFPHIVVPEWLPREVYDLMIKAIPPAVFFADDGPARQQLAVPVPFAPAWQRLAWRFISDHIVRQSLARALTARFKDVLDDYIRSFCPAAGPLQLSASGGRLMLRRPGYVIAPHRDPKWGFLTALAYLARDKDNEAYGTQLYRVANDEDAPSAKPYYVDEARCTLVRHVPFRANTLLVFLNSTGAHGATIPADAQPANLERYVFQFRLGPHSDEMSRLLAAMPDSVRASWVRPSSKM